MSKGYRFGVNGSIVIILIIFYLSIRVKLSLEKLRLSELRTLLARRIGVYLVDSEFRIRLSIQGRCAFWQDMGTSPGIVTQTLSRFSRLTMRDFH